MSPEPIALTYAEAGASVGVSAKTIERAVAAGDLTVRYIGKSPRIPVADLRAWFDALPSTKP